MKLVRRSGSRPWRIFPQPLDQVVVLVLVGLSLITVLLLWGGDRTAPRVRDFSWQDQTIGAEDMAFILTFNHPMDQTSVVDNLQIDPPLPGKVSWAGRRMAYTLAQPAPYGSLFQLRLTGSRERFASLSGEYTSLEPFVGYFQTRDRAFTYISTTKETEGQLVLYNLTRQEERILTPKNLVVLDFQAYPQGDRLLFSAASREAYRQGHLDTQLYTVTTGLKGVGESPSGQLTLILDNQNYQNLKFDLASNGQYIVVQRASRDNLTESGLWLLAPEQSPYLLTNKLGGDFLITPDGQRIVVAQGQGLAILPLPSLTGKAASSPNLPPLDFLPRFGQILGFSRDGTAAAMVQFNPDYTRSLFLVNTGGGQKELLRTEGSILSAAFDPTNRILYCLLTALILGDTYQEIPYVAAVNLATEEVTPLLQFPEQRDIQISLSPDGLALLFDQAAIAQDPNSNTPLSASGQPIDNSHLWVLPLVFDQVPDQLPQPALLPLEGIRPHWLP